MLFPGMLKIIFISLAKKLILELLKLSLHALEWVSHYLFDQDIDALVCGYRDSPPK